MTPDEAHKIAELISSSALSVHEVTQKPVKSKPKAPFITSTLQQAASTKLGFNVKRTMRTAQKLYENGLITYMRTDSVNLSDTALEAAEKEIRSSYGDKFSKRKSYSTKSKGAQEAHEAIRPSDMSLHSVKGDSSQAKLYDLIWKRTLASQMSDAEFERTNVGISLDNTEERFTAKG